MSIFEGYRLEEELVERLCEALRGLPDIEVNEHNRQPGINIDSGIDAEIEFNAAGSRYLLLVEVKKSIYPRDAQQALWQLDRHKTAINSDRKRRVVPLLAAESISSGAKELLKDENCGYFDSGGSLFIPARGAYVFVEKPPPKTLQKTIRGLFNGKRSQVLHTLLTQRDEWFGVKELAGIAEVAPSTASETLTALERFEWLTVRGQGPTKERRLADPGALLDEWRKQTLAATRKQARRRFYISMKDPNAIAHQFADICEEIGLKYALTEQSAAQAYSPFLSSISRVTCRLAHSSRASAVYEELEAQPVTEGANLEVIETRSQGEFLFRERVDQLWLASPVQVYLDLLRSGGRSKEMAEHLRQERIGF
ncbi:type IV toxin-antitoxin system AbiEi family antitoxin [Shimia abyssi]|uniref:Transcriptional regulator with AbiEi antitoxin domain of type IV toxin-antitoxin system n=1 Tax=Shimia abyssi TaxID=1662395 RepID=A0A2P8F6H0_9RHOB|nr:type IV toxin-antitoxin system AbiEi family antitoxin [Shimia abyssi]PSL17309.1 transcriptional regulator with AbiEi antitoxin domain of type IV toxin-antitoxin system [Shimia abyssi]